MEAGRSLLQNAVRVVKRAEPILYPVETHGVRLSIPKWKSGCHARDFFVGAASQKLVPLYWTCAAETHAVRLYR